MSTSRKRSRQSIPEDAVFSSDSDSDSGAAPSATTSSNSEDGFSFTQEAPELSQSFALATDKEKENAAILSKDEREILVRKMLRYFVLKSFTRDHVVKTDAVKHVLANFAGNPRKVLSVIFNDAAKKLKALYGFELKEAPDYMKRTLASKYKDRYYIINSLAVADAGDCVLLHDRYDMTTQGLLMVVLVIVYNKGALRTNVDKRSDFKWVSEEMLYEKLHNTDPSIPKEKGAKKDAVVPFGMTEDVGAMLDKFVERDYLIKDKIKPDDDSSGVYYTMGPRAALEIGRKQIITFTAEILGEQPDPSMLAELEADDESEEETEA